MIVAAVAGSGDDRAPIAANDWPGITDVPDPLSVFDPTLGGAGPTGFRPLLPRDQITPVYLRFFQNGVFWLPTGLVPVAGCTWDQGTDAWNLRGLVECGE